MSRRDDAAARRAAVRYRAAAAALDRARMKALCSTMNREVSWRHGNHVRWGRVVDFGHGFRVKWVKVVGSSSGKEYWLDPWRIREINDRAR